MNSLDELQRRKAELKTQIEQQKLELKKTFFEIRQDIQPSALLKGAVGGVFRFFKNKSTYTQAGSEGRLPGPLSFWSTCSSKTPNGRSPSNCSPRSR